MRLQKIILKEPMILNGRFFSSLLSFRKLNKVVSVDLVDFDTQ